MEETKLTRVQLVLLAIVVFNFFLISSYFEIRCKRLLIMVRVNFYFENFIYYFLYIFFFYGMKVSS